MTSATRQPVDAGGKTPDSDTDQPVCDYPQDWYIGALAIATSKCAKLLHGLVSLLKTRP